MGPVRPGRDGWSRFRRACVGTGRMRNAGCSSTPVVSIEDHFEFLQEQWANFSCFPGNVFRDYRVDGPDPVIGDSVNRRREEVPDTHLDFGLFVHTTGSVYAFVPLVSTLRKVANCRDRII